MFIPVSVSCLIVVCRLVDKHNNFYFLLFLAARNQLITLINMNFNIYNNNTIFNTGPAKLNIMNNAMHMACKSMQCTWHVELSSMISIVRDQSQV